MAEQISEKPALRRALADCFERLDADVMITPPEGYVLALEVAALFIAKYLPGDPAIAAAKAPAIIARAAQRHLAASPELAAAKADAVRRRTN